MSSPAAATDPTGLARMAELKRVRKAKRALLASLQAEIAVVEDQLRRDAPRSLRNAFLVGVGLGGILALPVAWFGWRLLAHPWM